MHMLRTRIKKDIVCEFLPPARRSNKVIILAGGAPSYPGKSPVPEFLSEKGYWVFIPRYRGTWESGGSFLEISPHRDLLDVVAAVPKGFKDLWSGKIHCIARPEMFIIGTSFGGAAAILASRDPRVRKAVALSPVTDWRVETKAEPIDKLTVFTRAAFGGAYRGPEKNWKKLKMGTFYNPIREAPSISGAKLLIIHAEDDKVIYAKTSAAFARMTGAKFIILPQGGHLGTSSIAAPQIWNMIRRFLK
jgi:dipeptidyl aminopeptidase/acylaminoacyl peptidase